MFLAKLVSKRPFKCGNLEGSRFVKAPTQDEYNERTDSLNESPEPSLQPHVSAAAGALCPGPWTPETEWKNCVCGGGVLASPDTQRGLRTPQKVDNDCVYYFRAHEERITLCISS